MERVWKSANETAAKPLALQIVFYIDNDDKESLDKLRQMVEEEKTIHGSLSQRIECVLGERLLMGSDMWNIAYEKAIGDIVWLGGDDNIFRTDGWDEIVRKTFNKIPDKIAYVYGSDGLRADDLGTHGFVHRNWVNAVGFFTPPRFVFYKSDLWLTKVASDIKRKYFLKDDFLIDHMHYTKGRSPRDDTYRERMSMFKSGQGGVPYKQHLSQSRGEAVQKLTQFIANYK